MRLFFSILFLSIFLASGYAQGIAGLTIPAKQTFVLGEYRTEDYKASVSNTGNQEVTVLLLDRKTRETIQRVEVRGGARQSLKVPAEQVLHLVNAGNQAAELKVKSPVSGREGMSYINPLETSVKTRRTKVERPSPAPRSSVTEEVDLRETLITKATLEPGQSLIIGEGSAGDFNVTLSNNGSGLEVSGRTKENGHQTQGFGIGKFGKVDMYLRPNEMLYLVNNSDKRSTVKVKTDRPVKGVRII